MANNTQEQFGECLEKIKKLDAKVQKRAFDSILKNISADSSDKEIANTIKEVLFWVSELC